MSEIDPKAFRMALGSFATGVTVVTTKGLEGEDIGVTASSFNTVSLEPPLVLWSLDKRALSLSAFEQSEHFTVNVLSADQVEISNRFARAGEDKFADLEVERGAGGIALLPGCSARFQCTPEHSYDGGDHIILVGRVIEFDVTGRPGLVFQAGRYAVGSDHPMMSRQSATSVDGGFVKNFLPYLTGRCHQEVLSKFQQTIESGPLSDPQYRLLFILKDLQKTDLDTLCQMSLLSVELVELSMSELLERGLITEQPPLIAVTEAGLEELSHMEAAVLASEAQMLSVFSREEAQEFKSQMAKLVEWNCQ
jgi:3-hydroxy-9,10-secoandrosta-1,3,5(10)-triene-9,17-dione monooxygenase reductase component